MNDTTCTVIAAAVGFVLLNQLVGFINAYWAWALLLIALVVIGWAGNWHRRRNTSSGLVTRWSARSRRRHGVATALDITRVASSFAVRQETTGLRPSLQNLTWVQRLRLPADEAGILLCRVGALRVWSSLRDGICVFGGPGSGKTWWLAERIIGASGAVLTTSTRLDLWNRTATQRASGGRPVFVFNPGGLGGTSFPSTVTFDPLHGCETPLTAVERATDLIPDAGGGDGERWDQKARRNLAVLLHAAAVAGLSYSTVAEWVADLNGSEREILTALRRSPEPSFATAAKQLLGLNEKTKTSITDAIMPAFSWLIDPDAVAASTGTNQLDVETLIAQRGTVYLLGREEGHTAPLLAALTGHIARAARRLAATKPGGRLDPPLTLALDEAARIAPVPLPDWSGDFGGSGICIIAAFQSRGDMIARWGNTAAGRILTNSGGVLVFGGTKDPEDLNTWATLIGEHDEPNEVPEKFGKTESKAVRRAPVLSASQISHLPKRHVLVIRRGMPPAVGKVKTVRRRKDVRRAKKLTCDVASGVAPPVAHHTVATPTPQPVTPTVATSQTGVTP